MHKLLISLLVLGAAAAPAAHAQDVAMPAPATPTAPPAVSTGALSPAEQAYVDQEAALVRSLRLMILHAQIAEQRRKLVGDQPQTAPAATLSDPIVVSGGVVQDLSSHTAAALPFSLVSIWGSEGFYNADLMTGSLRVTVKEGDTLPDGWRVTNIARTGMRIVRGKTTRTVMVGS